MAPKRRCDTVVKEIPKMYTFGRSLIDGGDIASLQKNRMVGTARAPGRETVPKPQDNEVVIFQDLLFAVLRFPLHPVLVDILWYFDIYLHQLTPNAILRLSCICGFVGLRRSNLPPKVLLRRTKSIINVALSSKRRGATPWRKTASLVA
jgi:hypothetical protein